MQAALDEIFATGFDTKFCKPAVECKLFGLGSEDYVVGSHEFFLCYAMTHKDVMVCLDMGHFHISENVADKISSLEGDPAVFLCGDFNMPFENERMAPLKAILGHANDDAAVKDTAPTFNGWGKHNSYLDHIFYRNAVAKKFEVVDDFGKYGAIYLSDHNPVYCDFVVKSR